MFSTSSFPLEDQGNVERGAVKEMKKTSHKLCRNGCV